MSDSLWKASRGAADWVAVIDMDEHIHHPDLPAHLARCGREGVTAVRAVGYEMVADAFPGPADLLSHSVTRGFRYREALDKLCLFDPAAIGESNFHAGRHGASPTGRVAWDDTGSVKLLHYKQLGLDYFVRRTAELRTGLRPGDRRNGWGAHYDRTTVELERDFLRHSSLARPVPGLGKPGLGRPGLGLPEADPEVHLVVHGMRISPTTVENNRFRFALPSGATTVRIVSPRASVATPLLGVAVEELILWHADRRRDIPLASSHLRDGWWGVARQDDRVTRWTDGNALVVMPASVPEASVLEVRLTGYAKGPAR